MFKILTQRAKELGVKLMLQTPVTKLIKENGKIVGVVAEDKSGEEITVRSKAVIIATGGFGANPKMIKKQTGYEWGKDLHTFAIPGLEGDGMRMAWEVGAMPSHMRMELSFGVADPMGLGLEWLPVFHQPHLMVNLLGERFMNEGEGNDSFKGNAISLQKDRTAYLVFDETIKDSMKTYLDFINLVIQIPNVANIDEMIAKVLESNYPHFSRCQNGRRAGRKDRHQRRRPEGDAWRSTTASATTATTKTSSSPSAILRPVKKGPYYALASIRPATAAWAASRSTTRPR